MANVSKIISVIIVLIDLRFNVVDTKRLKENSFYASELFLIRVSSLTVSSGAVGRCLQNEMHSKMSTQKPVQFKMCVNKVSQILGTVKRPLILRIFGQMEVLSDSRDMKL